MTEYFYAVVDYFLHPTPADSLDILLLGIVYTVALVYTIAIVGGMVDLIKLTFFETFFAKWAKPFSIPNRQGAKRILIVGDSTAVGAGATKPEDSIAGRLAKDFPNADIVNIGINGALTRDALRALSSVANQHFEFVIVSVGGNDVWHGTSPRSIRRDLHSLLMSTELLTDGPVILLLYNNIGSHPIFPALIRWLLKRRADKINTVFQEVAREMNIPVIELFLNDDANPFLKDPRRYFARDGVHPSSEGYGLWYNRMWRLLVSRGYTF